MLLTVPAGVFRRACRAAYTLGRSGRGWPNASGAALRSGAVLTTVRVTSGTAGPRHRPGIWNGTWPRIRHPAGVPERAPVVDGRDAYLQDEMAAQVSCAHAAAFGDLVDRQVCGFQQPAGVGDALGQQPPHRRGAGGGVEAPDERPLAGVGLPGQ